MKKLLLTVVLVLLVASVALAQEVPAADVAAGYSAIVVAQGLSPTANGGSGSVALNVNNWLGAVGDFGLYASPYGSGLAAGTYTFGPRV